MPPTNYVVYVLSDPRDNAIRYVGVSSRSAYRRLWEHIHRALKTPLRNHRVCWIRSLLQRGLEPVLTIVESGTGDWAESERTWIAAFRGIGCNLVNGTDGGDGVMGLRHSSESKARMAIAHLGKRASVETRAKMSRSRRGHPGVKFSPEALARMSASHIGRNKGIPLSPETRAKLSASKLGRVGHKHTPESRVKLSKTLRGHEVSQETRAKIGVAKRGHKVPVEKRRPPGYKHSPETRAKLSASRLGRTMPPETRKKISAAGLGRTVSPETRAKLRAAHLGRKMLPEARAKMSAFQHGRKLLPEVMAKRMERLRVLKEKQQ